MKPARSAYARAKYLVNPQAVKDRVAKWNAENPEKSSALRRHIGHVRRAREKTTPHEATLIKRFIALHAKRKRHRCYYCGAKFHGQFHTDHIEALAAGGKHVVSNLCISCPPCNMSKQAKPLHQLTHVNNQSILPL